MSFPRLRSAFALLSLLAFSGCSLVHFGRLPDNPAALADDNTRLQAENSHLQQELALAQKQGSTLRSLLETGPDAPAASRQLVAELNETTRQLAALRNDYARLKAEHERLATPAANRTAPAPGAPGPENPDQLTDLKTQLSDTENKLAAALRTYTQLEQENAQLHTEVDKVREQNSTLATQVKDVTAQNKATQAALAQLNTEMLAQKEARARTQQEAESLRTQLSSANERIATLSAARSSAAGSAQTISPGMSVAANTGATEPAARFETSAARARAARTAPETGSDTADLVSQLSQLRAKVDSLETERSGLQRLLAATAGTGPANPGNGVTQTDAEANLATALRSYSVVQAENDQLKVENEKAAAEKAAIEAQLAATKGAVPIAAQANALREQLRQTQAQAAALAAENSQLKTRLALNGPVAVPQPATLRAESTAPTRPGPVINPQPAIQNPQSSAPAPRSHTIATGDTLAKISRQYYGTPDRWSDILAANRDILRDEKSLVIGRVIRIP